MLQASPCSVSAASPTPAEVGPTFGEKISKAGCVMNVDLGVGHNVDGQFHVDDNVVVSVGHAGKVETLTEDQVKPSTTLDSTFITPSTWPQAALPASEYAISKDVMVVGLPGSRLQGCYGRVRGYNPATDTCLVEFSWEQFRSTGDVNTPAAIGNGHAEHKSTKKRFRVKNKPLTKLDATDADCSNAVWQKQKPATPNPSQDNTDANAATKGTQKYNQKVPSVNQDCGRQKFNCGRNSNLLNALHIDV